MPQNFPQSVPSPTSARPNLPQLVAQLEGFSGPLPPPEVLEKYNQIVPGAAARIMAWAEEQTRHRQDLEKRVVAGNLTNQKRGQWMAFGLGLAILGVAVVMIKEHMPIEGLAITIAEIAALAGIFVLGRYTQKKELAEKRDSLIHAPRKSP